MRNIFIVIRDLMTFIKFCAISFQSFSVGGKGMKEEMCGKSEYFSFKN